MESNRSERFASGSRRLRMQAGILGIQMRPVRCRLPAVSRLHAVSLRLPRDSAVPRLRGRLLVQGERLRGVLRSVQAWILCAHQG